MPTPRRLVDFCTILDVPTLATMRIDDLGCWRCIAVCRARLIGLTLISTKSKLNRINETRTRVMWPRVGHPWRLGDDKGGTDGDRARADKMGSGSTESLRVFVVVDELFHGHKAIRSFAFVQSRTRVVSPDSTQTPSSGANAHSLHPEP